jgi:dimethylhistidine N-methyltransferase
MHKQPVNEFGEQVRLGLTRPGQKTLPTKYLYDDVGSALFDAITAVEEYGLTRAELRILNRHAPDIGRHCAGTTQIAELGSGNGSKTRLLLNAFPDGTVYRPIDLSRAALDACRKELAEWPVQPIHADYLHGLAKAAAGRNGGPMLLLFLGRNVGNFDRACIPDFFRAIRRTLRTGDAFLLGADLVKGVPRLIAAYDDAAGVNAAFNRNLLLRVNRELAANFDPRCFDHEIRWNAAARSIEMHLRARAVQTVQLDAIDLEITIQAGETIHTESSHKFEPDELRQYADNSGFTAIASWQDEEWPFAEVLMKAV